MKTKKSKPEVKRRSLRKAISNDSDDLFRGSVYENESFLVGLQTNYYGSMDRYIQQRIHDCY